MTTCPTSSSDKSCPSGKSTIIRQTQPIRYSHNSSISRIYDLFEIYTRSYGKTMCSSSTSTTTCDINDTSFGIDASNIFPNQNPGQVTQIQDSYSFTSKYNQFVHINLIPYGGTPGLPGQFIGGSWDDINITMSLSCGLKSSNKLLITTLSSTFSSTKTSQNTLIPFITTRLNMNELCDIQLKLSILPDSTSSNNWNGYYLFVTGSGFNVVKNNEIDKTADLWGTRKQSNGLYTFNINGPHQKWIPFSS